MRHIALGLHMDTICHNTRCCILTCPPAPVQPSARDMASPSRDHVPHPSLGFLDSSMLPKGHVALPAGGLPRKYETLEMIRFICPGYLCTARGVRISLCNPMLLLQQCEARWLHCLLSPICHSFDPNSHCSGATQPAGLALVLPLLIFQDIKVGKWG